SINVVTRAMIDDMGWQDPNSFLPASTAAVSGYGIPSPNQGLYVRGFRAQNWSVDGATEASFSQLDNFNYNAFEVVKGPSALLYGPFGAFGGYVNMIPKYAGEEGEVNQAQITLGTSQYSSELLDIGHALNPSGSLQGRLVMGEYDSHRAGKPGDFFHMHTFAPSFTYNISARSKVKFRMDVESSHVRVSETAENAAGEVLRNYTDDGPEGLQPDLGTEDRSVTTQTVFTSQLSDEWSIKANFMTEDEYYQSHSITLAQNKNTGLIGSLQYPQPTYQYQKEKAIISFNNWYGSFTADWRKADLGHGLNNDLVLSGDMNNWTDDYQYLGLSQTVGVYPQYNVPPYTTFNPSDPNYASVANMDLTPPQFVQPYAQQWLGGLNAMDTVGMFNHKLQLVMGTRFNYDSRSSYSTTRATAAAPLTGSPSAVVTEELWLKRYGLVYQPTPHIAVYYGHDEGYIAVGVGYTYQGQLIKPQSGKENEVGIKTDLFHALGGEWSSTVAYFQLRVTNINLADPAHFGYYLEEDAEQNSGFDAQITYMSDRLSGTIGIYDADGPYNPITHVRVPYAPKMTFVSWLRYNITPALSVGGGWRYQGNSLDGFSNNVLAPYNTLSLFSTYAHKLGNGRIVYRLGVSNATNATAAYM
ncbi:MAG: TonB-dependent siderophore receptor, partial [Candidatus Micrarchaeaceae archaeon]